MLFRQGDVFVQRVRGIPSKSALQVEPVVAEGELTGHQHRILDAQSAQLYRHGTEWYLDVVDDFAQLVHDEHATIWLERGQYRVWRQREYSPEQHSRDGRSVRLVSD
jgi:hypothetical protein